MKAFIPSLIVTSLLLISCGSNNSDPSTSKEEAFSCTLENSLALKSSTVAVSQNSINLSTKIIQDMNRTMDDINRMNEAVYTTMNISAQTLQKLAEPLKVSADGQNLFVIDPSKDPCIKIKDSLSKKYILVSSPSRFFPYIQSVKTLFKDADTLTSALDKAFDGVDSSKNLYLTILELESDNTFTNLTNGILIKGQ